MRGEKYQVKCVITSCVFFFDEITIKELSYDGENTIKTSIGQDYIRFVNIVITQEEKLKLLSLFGKNDYDAQGYILDLAKERCKVIE